MPRLFEEKRETRMYRPPKSSLFHQCVRYLESRGFRHDNVMIPWGWLSKGWANITRSWYGHKGPEGSRGSRAVSIQSGGRWVRVKTYSNFARGTYLGGTEFTVTSVEQLKKKVR